MTGKPARGPQLIVRADGTETWTTGTLHTLLVRAIDLVRTRNAQTVTEHNPSDAYQRALRAANTSR